jgi:hypothetical protein
MASAALKTHYTVEQFRQGDDWLRSAQDHLDDTLSLTSIDCSVSLRDIYSRVGFAKQETGKS